MAQVQSSASVKLEVSINKTVTDFKTAMDKQQTTILKSWNAESSSFYKDAKEAISAVVTTSVKVANVGVNKVASRYYEVVAKVSAAITESLSTLTGSANPDAFKTLVSTVINSYKDKLEKPIFQIKEKVVETIAESPKAQACIEKALKDVTILSIAANKNLTASFTLAIKNFTVKAKIYHTIIKTNVTLLTKSVDTCIAKRQEEAIFNCIDVILLEEDKVLSLITATESEITQLYIDAYLSLSIKTEEIETIVDSKKEEILAKVSACAPKPTTTQEAPTAAVEVSINV